jgi:hypothetical protein
MMGDSACSDIYRTSAQTSSRTMSSALCLEVVGAVWGACSGNCSDYLENAEYSTGSLFDRDTGKSSGKRLEQSGEHFCGRLRIASDSFIWVANCLFLALVFLLLLLFVYIVTCVGFPIHICIARATAWQQPQATAIFDHQFCS